MRPCQKPRAKRVRAISMPCDGWTMLTPERQDLASRYLEIMREMNRTSYSPARPKVELWRMTHSPCEYFYFAGARFEIALGFKWIRRVKRFRVMSVGFTGAINSDEALDRIAAKMRAFALCAGIDRLIAVRPHSMDSPRILELYGLLKEHPALRVRGGHYVTAGEYLWIGFRN